MKSKAWMTGLKHWRWMPGMLDAETGLRVVKAGTDEDPRVGLGSLNDFILYHPDMLRDHYPDLDDPATLGCLLALVREAWGDPNLCVSARKDDLPGFRVGEVDAWWDSEGSALLASIEAAGCDD